MAEPESVGAWAPLRIRLFRSLWLAGVVSNLGTFMHTVGAGWSITTLTRDPGVVSLLQTMWAAPGFIFALLAGALADVIDRRKLMLTTQFASVLVAGTLGVLEVTDRLTVTSLLVLTFLLSMCGTLSAPAFMATTPELVPRELLTSAIGLNSISMNIAQSAGPAIAGVLIAIAGPGAVFLVNAASFIGIVIVVSRFRFEVDTSLPAEHIGSAMRTGVRYVRNSPALLVMITRIMLALTVTSALAALLPVIARKRLDVSAGQFGLLSASLGVGAVLAIGALPSVRRRLGADAIVAISAVIWAVGAAIVATAISVTVACLGLAVAGGASMTTMTTIFSIYQSSLPSWVRGRASSVAMLVIWLGASVGSFGWGLLGSRIGVSGALLAAAAANVVLGGAGLVALRIGTAEVADITPVHWQMPALQVEPHPTDGPVLVSVEWVVDAERVAEFAQHMEAVGRQRRRDGAMQWGVFQDMEVPGRMVESFTVATWAEHERQHSRTIASDAVEQSPARALLVNGGPNVSHLISQRPSRVRNR